MLVGTAHMASFSRGTRAFPWYSLMSRATDEVGRVQSHEPRYNNMRNNFSAIVSYPITVA